MLQLYLFRRFPLFLLLAFFVNCSDRKTATQSRSEIEYETSSEPFLKDSRYQEVIESPNSELIEFKHTYYNYQGRENKPVDFDTTIIHRSKDSLIIWQCYTLGMGNYKGNIKISNDTLFLFHWIDTLLVVSALDNVGALKYVLSPHLSFKKVVSFEIETNPVIARFR